MSGIVWKDVTSYSQGERGKIDPRSWECIVEGVRIWVSCGHRYHPKTWVVNCHALGINERNIAEYPATHERDAKRLALRLVSLEAAKKVSLLERLREATA